MNRRVPFTFPSCSGLAVVVAAVSLVACGGPSARESVTAAPVVPSAPAMDQGVLSESGQVKVTICHKGWDRMVAPDAVADHEGHGDFVGTCSSGGCPCFFTSDITGFGQSCADRSATLSSQCFMSGPEDPAFLSLLCSAGTGPDDPSIYSSTGGGGICAWEQGPGVGIAKPVSGEQHEACVAVMLASGYCP